MAIKLKQMIHMPLIIGVTLSPASSASGGLSCTAMPYAALLALGCESLHAYPLAGLNVHNYDTELLLVGGALREAKGAAQITADEGKCSDRASSEPFRESASPPIECLDSPLHAERAVAQRMQQSPSGATVVKLLWMVISNSSRWERSALTA
jgi:hypothetical protein